MNSTTGEVPRLLLADALEARKSASDILSCATRVALTTAEPRHLAGAVRALFLSRQYGAALELLELGSGRFPDEHSLVLLLYALQKRLRFEQEASASLDRALAQADSPRLREAAAVHAMEHGDYDRALVHIRAARAGRPGATHFHGMRLDCALEAGRERIALDAAREVLCADPAAAASVFDALLRGGMVGGALDLIRPLPPRVEALVSLFRGDTSRATRIAAALLADPSCAPMARTVLLGAAVLSGDLGAAAAMAAPSSPDPAWDTWKAELLLLQNKTDAAEKILLRQLDRVPDYLAAKLLLVRCRISASAERRFRRSSYEGLFEGQLQATGATLVFRGEFASRRSVEEAVGLALRALGGNRTPWPTIISSGGELSSVHVPASARHRARLAQHSAATKGLDVARRELRRLLSKPDASPVARCYLGELDLWQGDYRPAMEQFTAICEDHPQTTWAWIGKGAARLFLGDPQAALDIFERGVEVHGRRGASLSAYRGEALYRLGRLDRAAETLAAASADHPSRIGTWLVRLLNAEAMSCDSVSEECARHLSRFAAPLLSEAARVLDVEPCWPDSVPRRQRAPLARVALGLMRGNRSSSCVLWFRPGTNIARHLVLRPLFTSRWEEAERREVSLSLRNSCRSTPTSGAGSDGSLVRM